MITFWFWHFARKRKHRRPRRRWEDKTKMDFKDSG